MKTFVFQLGRVPDLSMAELVSVQQRTGAFGGLRREGGAALAEAESFEALESILPELGGTIRAGEALTEGTAYGIPDCLEECLERRLEHAGLIRRLAPMSPKPVFGISWIGDRPPSHSIRSVREAIHRAAAKVKDRLREQGVSSRFVLPAEERELCLSGAQAEKNRLLDEGLEAIFWHSESQGLQAGMTRWIQPYEAFSDRDYGRPRRDARSGMLPPKLARMMVQLALRPGAKTLIDPFCGSGGVLMEAALLGLHATGADNSPKAVEDAAANWEWVRNHSAPAGGSARALAGDARQLRKLCEPLYFDACATEPYLGPPQTKPLTKERFEKLSDSLCELYRRALGEIRIVARPGARVVFVSPRFETAGGEPASLPLLADLKYLGYRILDPLDGFKPTNRRAALLYARPGQIVQREIFVLQA